MRAAIKCVSAIALFGLSAPVASLQTAPKEACPNGEIYAVQMEAENLLIFGLSMDPATEGLTYNWTVSAGTIVEGQGTNGISVKAAKGDVVTASVEIGGLPAGCGNVASATLDMI